MKKLSILFAILTIAAVSLFAQAPQKFSYQAVVRDASNHLVTSQTVGVRVNILQGGVSGIVVYMETQTAVTNANGLITLQIGGGNVLSGNFATIDWSDGPFFLKTETDPTGGTNYSIEGTQQLLSVPYALYAGASANGFSGDYNDLTNTPTIPTVPTNVSAFNNDAGYLTMDSIPDFPVIPTDVSTFNNDVGYITSYTETDPTVPAWAKEANKPTYNYFEIVNTPTIPTVPTNVSVFTNDVGYITMDSIPDIPTVPVNISSFTNDAGYITSYTETQTLAEVTANGNSAGNRQLKDILDPVEAYDAVNLRTLTWMIDSLKTEFQRQLQQQQEVMQQQIDSLQDRIEELEENNSGSTTQIQPTVTSSTAANVTVTNITATSATLYGTVSNPDNVTITEQGFEWKVTQGGTYTAVNAIGTVMSYNLTGLTPNTSYTYRAFVTSTAGTNYGEEITFTTTASIGGVDAQPCPGTPTVTDIDGNTYNTVWIGNQCWMKENLRTTHYANGTAITQASLSQYSTTTRYYYNPGTPTVYGYLYNWPAAKGLGMSAVSANNQGICPTGWHVPSDGEWTQLTQYVGSQSQYLCSNNSTYIAKALASSTGWNTYYAGTCCVGCTSGSNNATGFSALPAGYCYDSCGGIFYGFGFSADLWSSTESESTTAYFLNIQDSDRGVYGHDGTKYIGRSVRCLRD